MRSHSIARAGLGAAAGFTFGYALARAAQGLRDLRTPVRAREGTRDPARYGAARRRLMLAGIARGMAGLAVSAFALAGPLDRALQRLPRAVQAPAFALTLFALENAHDLGVAYVEGHTFERVWGTTDQTPRAWLADHLKGTAVASAVVALLSAGAAAVVGRAPRRWPWLAIAATPPLLAGATILLPTFVLPLFNAYEPVGGELETRIRSLAARYGVGDAAILRFDLSRQTKKANAFVTGILGTERIALADTLVSAFAEDETLFVVAHELGHYVRRDPWTAIAAGTAAIATTLLSADAALRATTHRRMDSAAQATRLAFYAALVQLALTPLANAASRALERRADRFALTATGDRDAGIRAFRRLAEHNLAELDPPRWSQLLFASHPTLNERIAALSP